MFIDTHCHLNIMVDKQPNQPLEEIHLNAIKDFIDEAYNVDVRQIVNIGTTLAESINSITLAQRFGNVFAAIGMHPCEIQAGWRSDFDRIAALLKQHKHREVVGIGEIGLDFYHKPYDRSLQEDACKAQIELALEHDVAIVFHVRDATDELLKLIEPYAKHLAQRAVIHCFCHAQDFADVVTGWRLFIGIDGPITYPKNEWLRQVITKVPLEYLVLETDAPYLPPQVLRGKQNKPAYIPLFAQTIADLKKISLEALARATTTNTQRLFRLPEIRQ